jgi:DNA repair exonuclease SbcCD ATPase subunit
MGDFTPKRTFSLVAIIAILIAIIAFLGYYAYDLKQQVKVDVAALETKQQQLQRIYTKLDSISKVLDEKILEIQRLGGKVDALQKVKKQVEKEKYELKLSKKIPTDRYQKIIEKIKEYEHLLTEKDVEIQKLKVINEQLNTENSGLKQQADSIKEQLSTVSNTAEDLNKKIKAASILKVSYMLVQAVAENGKIRTEAEYKAKHIDILRITFRFDDNKAAEHGNKRLYLKIIDNIGKVICEESNGGGKFTYNQQESLYTVTQETLFDNSHQPFTLDYRKSKPFESGKYLIEIFCEDAMIGQGNFVVK